MVKRGWFEEAPGMFTEFLAYVQRLLEDPATRTVGALMMLSLLEEFSSRYMHTALKNAALQKSPLYPQTNPLFLQKSPLYPQNSLTERDAVGGLMILSPLEYIYIHLELFVYSQAPLPYILCTSNAFGYIRVWNHVASFLNNMCLGNRSVVGSLSLSLARALSLARSHALSQ